MVIVDNLDKNQRVTLLWFIMAYVAIEEFLCVTCSIIFHNGTAGQFRIMSMLSVLVLHTYV
jgi:hypothetical protein